MGPQIAFMSPIEILNLAAPAAPSPPTGERADASLFAGLLDGQAPPARGRLGVGRWLDAQAEVARRDPDGADVAVPAGQLIGFLQRPLVNSGPGGDVKPGEDGPLVNPGSAAKPVADQPLINPGSGAKGDDGQPLINPGPAQSKTDGAQVLPGVIEGDPQGPQINPAEPSVLNAALQALVGDDQSQSVTALAQAAQQAVSRAPEISTVPSVPSVDEVDLPAADPAAVALDAESATAGSALPGEAVAARPVATNPTGAVDPVAQGSTARSEIADPSAADESALDLSSSDAEALPAAARADAAAPAAVVRADAAAVAGRMSFDALAQVSAQIIRRLETRTTRFDMELNPVELGRVDVRLDIDSEGRLAARLAFDNPAAAMELRGRVDDLRRELQQAGFQLADDAFSFTDRGGSGGGRGFDAEDARRAHARSAEAADQIDAAAQPALRAMTRLGLDVRV